MVRCDGMSDSMTDPQAPAATPAATQAAQAAGRVARGFGVRSLARRARAVQLSGHALLGASVGLTALAAAVLLWGGIVTGLPRVLLLLAAAGLLRLRLLTVRLGSMTPADGMAAPAPRGGAARWMSPLESAVLLVAGGLNPFGSGSDISPVLGVVAAALLLAACIRRRSDHAVHEPSRPHATTLLAIVCLAAVFEPLWGWRGQTVIIGLCAISAVLIVQAWRAQRPAAG
jgi:hypothetical protein